MIPMRTLTKQMRRYIYLTTSWKQSRMMTSSGRKVDNLLLAIKYSEEYMQKLQSEIEKGNSQSSAPL